mgnify:CR=1 FL=1
MNMLAEDQRYTAKQRLERVYYQLPREPEYRLIGTIALHGEYYVDDCVPTAATNGVDVWYNPDFVQTLNDKELRFVVIHEQFHKMFKHAWMLKALRERDPLLTNMAADYCINLMIRDSDPTEKFIALPRDKDGNVLCLIDDAFYKLSTFQIFDILWEENQQEEGGSYGEESYIDSEQTNSDNTLSGQVTNAGQEILDGKYSQKIRDRIKSNHDDHKFDEIADDPEESAKAESEINSAIRQAIQIAGDEAGNFLGAIKEMLAVYTPWQDILKAFMKNYVRGKGTTTFRRFNRKTIGSGLYLPSQQTKDTGEVIVAPDASGSCWSVLPQFLSEIQTIAKECNPKRIRLLYWDAKVEREEVYEKSEFDTLIKSSRPSGGGGTDPTCAYEYIRDRINSGIYTNAISCVIILTDGYFYGSSYGDWQSLRVPVLWGINSKGNVDFNPRFGQKVIIREEA